MKRLLLIIFSLVFLSEAYANHIAGGELFYQYIGPGSTSGSNLYKITMRLFRDCHSTGAQLTIENPKIGIYLNSDLSLVTSITLALQGTPSQISLNTSAIPCLVNAPEVCFQIGIFTGTVDLPSSAVGYTLGWIRCCRSDNIANLAVSTGVGATFTTQIPGTNVLPSGHNSSPQFAVKDTALVCQNNFFQLDFGASDADGDSLSYFFCSANSGGISTMPDPGPSSTLALNSLPYMFPYSGDAPLGSPVTINSLTGKISGIAPASGRYVINVCVSEWRNGVVINVHRKDFILEVGNCQLAASTPVPHTQPASNQPQYQFVLCAGFAVNFTNASSGSIQSYAWDFGVASQTTDTSSQSAPSYTYPDTGIYTIRLIVKGIAGCIDTGYTYIGIYPGFDADFDVVGSCFKNPFVFTDLTATSYGVVDKWRWDFGDPLSNADTSTLKNVSYTYVAAGTKTATLIVSNSKGCADTATKTVIVRDAPLLTVPFHDTLICSIDTLQLVTSGSGIFAWTPLYNLINPASATPVVFPKDTTTYIVTLTENGCVSTDSIKVNVIDSVTVDAGRDTTICLTDAVRFHPVSEGLQYQWTPASELGSPANIKNAVALPNAPGITIYRVVASVGKCMAKDSLKIKAVAYPVADAGLGDSICYGKSTQLHAVIVGSRFTWEPTIFLSNPNSLNPIASPIKTTTYLLTVYDTVGCPKPSRDIVTVEVTPSVIAYAGNDTFIVANQPLQLHATGGGTYVWSPTIGMDSPFIATPVVVLGSSFDSIIYRVKVTVPPNCSDEDEMKVVIFKTGPDLFIPTGFTPNSDGKNDVLRPIAIGIKRLNYFRIYNRWGQVLYTSSQIGEGWDGTFQGRQQATATYVFTAQAVDYLGKTIFRKGTVLLIR